MQNDGTDVDITLSDEERGPGGSNSDSDDEGANNAQQQK